MFTQPGKFSSTTWVFLGVLIFLIVCIGTILAWDKLNSCYEERAPLRSAVIILDRGQQKQLLDQFNKFAEKHSFVIQVEPTTPSGVDFVIVMRRKDIEVISANPFSSDEFRIGFYNNSCLKPTLESDPKLDDLVDDLEDFIREIPNATFSVTR